jgi:hypothetical protein
VQARRKLSSYADLITPAGLRGYYRANGIGPTKMVIPLVGWQPGRIDRDQHKTANLITHIYTLRPENNCAVNLKRAYHHFATRCGGESSLKSRPFLRAGLTAFQRRLRRGPHRHHRAPISH